MAVDYSYSAEKGIIEINFSGSLAFEDYLELTEELATAKGIGFVEAAIHNMLEVESIDMNIAGASAIGDASKRLPVHLQPRFEAVVSTNSVHIGLSIVYSLARKPQREFRVFRTHGEASEWIKERLAESDLVTK